ncbi:MULTISPECIES: hypothetical protein [Alphaproteobacteria]|jgi:hypothetical protein|uniref:hypothetical protein n=1 Tax=Alphaproteobacteria TaxID=28211 RepID=UPI0008243709|nr:MULTISPECIES: hypothetical protein [Alphaproteobacteria]MBX9875133.1 hypothetical protein [Beijerinckiaceae bacterium]MDU7523720.1 hypothetical protein [Roseomonas mucosa]MBF5088491.1 hypothetical protein [Novosphingobium sp. NBM11]MBP2149764.1 hypothetical protein [Xanthobacter flavus]NTE96336.1 hypothetical protein [Agrobacterium tumefaciens]
MAAITAQAKPERRHALRSPTLYGLMASGQRLDQGSAHWKRGMVFRHDRGHHGNARSMLSRQSIAAMLPVVMLPTWPGMIMQSAVVEENAHAEGA